MDFLDEIEDKTLLIVENNMKNIVLDYINNTNKLINVKIMTKNEFIKHYFYDYTEEAIDYVAKNYQVTLQNAKLYIDNLKYVIDLEDDSKKVVFEKNLYKDLVSKGLLIIDDLFKDYLIKINLKVLISTKLEPFYIKIFEYYNASFTNLKSKVNLNEPLLYHFKTIEEECAFLFNKISLLIKSGISPAKIKLTNVCDEYIPYLKRFSNLYNLKINNLNTYSLYGTIYAKNILEMITLGKSREEILNYIEENLDKEIFTKIFNILNKYYFQDNFLEVIDLIKEDFKKTSLKTPIYEEALTVTEFNSYLFLEDDYVFLLGFNLEHIPKTYKDIDYLSDDLKTKIGLFSSVLKNKIASEEVIFHLKNTNNLIITYKDVSPYQNYYPSNLIEELKLEIRNETLLNETSNLYNQIMLTDSLDNYLKYSVLKENTDLLYNTYPDIKYLNYNNKFSGINDELSKITLSYTSLNTYYHCAFRYYIDNILKLNIYEDTFKIYIGNLFHFILSKIFNEDFSFMELWNTYIKERKFNFKEEFYLELLKQELLEIIEIIKYQHNLSFLTNVKLEQEIILNLNSKYTFKGIIDKIMYKAKDLETYISLIDYKTGVLKTDMSNLQYGLDMQLPIYVYLIKASKLFENPKILGFYLQQIVTEKISFNPKKTLQEMKKEALKLKGYTIDSEYLVSLLDETYQNSEMIYGMKTTSKGFSYYTKVLSEEAIDNLVSIVDKKIKEAFQEIEKLNFQINPKVIGGKMVGCAYCKYQDLCFKTGRDLVYLEKEADLSYLEEEQDA